MAELNVEVDSWELIDSLVRNMTNEELIEFIIDLDNTIIDWDFTEALYHYFKQEHKTYKEEMKAGF